MGNTTISRDRAPVSDQPDSGAIAFQQESGERSPLDEIIREGARRMLQAAIDAEVDAFIEAHRDRRDEQGRRQVVRNGKLPAGEISMTAPSSSAHSVNA